MMVEYQGSQNMEEKWNDARINKVPFSPTNVRESRNGAWQLASRNQRIFNM
jgi:hypothetical protein